jgi:hypothetical protein
MQNSITTWLKKNWVPIALVIGILILFFIVWKQHSEINTYSVERRTVKAEQDSILAREREANKNIYTIAKARDSVNYIKDSALIELGKVKVALRATMNTNVSLADQVRAAKLLRDTARYVVACDSLVEENNGLLYLVSEYQKHTDSIMGMMAANEKRSDSILVLRTQLYNNLRNSTRLIDSSYNNLFDAYSKQSKQLKRERTKTKVTAALGIALTVLALLK